MILKKTKLTTTKSWKRTVKEREKRHSGVVKKF